MWKRKILLLCLMLLLTGCNKGAGDHAQGREGVYYPEISEEAIGGIYNPMALYTRSLLSYNGRIYTSGQRYSDTDREKLPFRELLGDELSVVQGNHGVYWSIDGKNLSEITVEGTLYQVNGYDESFCVGIYYEIPMPLSETVCQLVIFEQLNDLTLYQGRELFEERMHLGEAVRIVYMREKDGADSELSTESAEVREFLEALYDGLFLDPAEPESSALRQKESGTLSFYAPNGLITDIHIYEDGYVTMEKGTENIFFVKTDSSKCKNIMNCLPETKK